MAAGRANSLGLVPFPNSGQVRHAAEIADPYRARTADAEFTIDTSTTGVEESVGRILMYLRRQGCVGVGAGP